MQTLATLPYSVDMAKYKDIADDLRRRIQAGEFPVGAKLPGLTDLEAHYGAALNTVRAAQALLQEEGLLRIAQGEGAFVLQVPTTNPADLLETLRAAHVALARAIESLKAV